MWTDAWKRLLGRPDALGAVARSSLWGLTAQLRRAAEDGSEDEDGRRDCLAVVDALGDLAASAAVVDVATAGEVSARRPRLAALAGEFLADADVARALGHPGWDLGDAPDSRLWSLILGGLLRVDGDVASRWRIRALEAARGAGFATAGPTLVVPMAPGPPTDDEGMLGPDLLWPGRGGAGELVATGIRFDERGPFDPRFTPPESCEPDLAFLARVASCYAALSEVDDQLWHAPTRSSVLRVLSGEERTVYLNRLADGFHAVRAAESRFAATPNPHNAENLLALWIDLDETFHSLIPLPACGKASWWSRTQDAARGALLRAFDRIRAGGVELDLAYRVLKGSYEGVAAQSARDVRLPAGGPPGQVVACLRVYVESHGDPRPGRVVFVSP
jgi:hypothetical protein